MNLLLHVCCGPCSIFPISCLQNNDIAVTGYFFNPNIHPFKEFKRRLIAAEDYSRQIGINLISEREYGLIDFLRAVVHNESERCLYCYDTRLEKTVLKAKEEGFDSFSSTLLYSRYQNHSRIKSVCEKLSRQHSIAFHYEDFRAGWQTGIDKSKDLNMYRQPYCGCIYSEQERYDKSLRKPEKNRK